MRTLRNASIVITGASSGIGAASALAFARQGARLTLAARDATRLQAVAEACEREGGQAQAVPTDVGNPVEMRELAERAIAGFGGIDVWINNAGVGAVGPFTATPIESHDKVILTNLLGYLHGAHAVLPHFLRRRTGMLINNNSFGGWVPAPFAAAYSASKFGLRGLSESLRAELSGFPGIHVCDVFPSFIDTPGVQHGANYTGRRLRPAPPLYSADRVATAMLSLAQRPRPSVTVGLVARLARLGYALSPSLTRLILNNFMRAYLSRARSAPGTDGNLFHSTGGGWSVSGGWRSPAKRVVLLGSIAMLAGFACALLTARRPPVVKASDQTGRQRLG
jgi:short-subunit dehydrogenase